MREQKYYVCDFCHTQYQDEKNALKCENNHHTPKQIKKSKYHAASCEQDGYPDRIEVVFENGVTVWYKK